MNLFAEFLVSKGLYDSIVINQDNIQDLIDLIGGKVRINCFCRDCGDIRTFVMKPIECIHDNTKNLLLLSDELERVQRDYALNNTSQPCFIEEMKNIEWYWKTTGIDENVRIIIFKFVCTFDDTHHLDYVVITDNNQMVKIGQFPSVADIDFPQLKHYQKVASKQDMQELKRAIGLHAQGIGIGSFVYIRRIFERLVDKAKELALEDNAITLEDYESKNKIVDKVKLLIGYLPDILTKNTVAYGIVSKGIHELSEEDCLAYFPVMKDFTIMILEQWNQDRKQKEAEKKISSAISNIATKIN